MKQEEVADFLILHHGTGLLVEQKSEGGAMGPEEGEGGLSRLRRALTGPSPFGVTIPPRHWLIRSGLPPIEHGIVTVEIRQPVDLQSF